MSAGVPVGSVCPFAGQVHPVSGHRNDVWRATSCEANEPVPGELAESPLNHLEARGWMLCDGRWLSADGYPELFAVIGRLYGWEESGARFRLPDYRGLFLRGFDAGAGMDPDADQRSAPTGGNVANVVGSLQCDALQDHTHHYDVVAPAAVSQSGQAAGTAVTSKPTTAPDAPARTSSETRARNIAVNYIIKFR